MIEKLTRIFGSRTKALEMLYLMHGLKPVVRQGFYETELSRVKAFCKENDLAIETAPYKVVLADKHKIYSNKGFKARIEDPRKGMFFVYISKDERRATEARVYEMKDNHRELGLALGYPECCVEFFVENYPKRSGVDNDYVIPALKNSEGKRFPFYTNICKRVRDATLLNHFPHSFDCEESIAIAKKNFKLIEELDPLVGMRLLHELKGRVRIGGKEVEFY